MEGCLAGATAFADAESGSPTARGVEDIGVVDEVALADDWTDEAFGETPEHTVVPLKHQRSNSLTLTPPFTPRSFHPFRKGERSSLGHKINDKFAGAKRFMDITINELHKDKAAREKACVELLCSLDECYDWLDKTMRGDGVHRDGTKERRDGLRERREKRVLRVCQSAPVTQKLGPTPAASCPFSGRQHSYRSSTPRRVPPRAPLQPLPPTTTTHE